MSSQLPFFYYERILELENTLNNLIKELNKSFALLWTFIFKLVEKIDKITDVLNELVDEADEKSRIIEAIKTEMTNMKKEVYDYIVQMLEEGGEDNADANGEKQN